MMIQEWDRNARKAIKKRQLFESQIGEMNEYLYNILIGAPGVEGLGFSPAVPQRFAPSAQACMNIPCICPYMGVSRDLD